MNKFSENGRHGHIDVFLSIMVRGAMRVIIITLCCIYYFPFVLNSHHYSWWEYEIYIKVTVLLTFGVGLYDGWFMT